MKKTKEEIISELLGIVDNGDYTVFNPKETISKAMQQYALQELKYLLKDLAYYTVSEMKQTEENPYNEGYNDALTQVLSKLEKTIHDPLPPTI